MSEQNLLSNEEIEALLQAVGTGVNASRAAVAPGEVRSHPLHEQDHVVGRLPTLELVNDRFLRLLRATLARLLRRPVEVTARPIETIRFNEYIASLPTPSNLNRVRVKPLRGSALVVLEAELVRTTVDNYFGGNGAGSRGPGKDAPKEFTLAEMRVVQLLLQQALTDLAAAWAPATTLGFEYLDSETNPHFAGIATPREQVVVSRFLVELDGGGGDFGIAMPWTMLEPIRDVLSATLQEDRAERDEKWSRALRGSFLEAEVEALGTLATVRSSLGRILRLRIGDIIPLDIPDAIPLTVDGVTVFRGKFGLANGRNAVRITEIINRAALEREQQRMNTP